MLPTLEQPRYTEKRAHRWYIMTFSESLIELRKGFRLRVGDYRIIFDKKGSILLIKKIDNRGQIYKGV